MGVIYVAAPIIDETRRWLDDLGVLANCEASRLPTAAELSGALRALPGFEVEIETPEEGGYFAFVEPQGGTPEDRRTRINVHDYSGLDQPCTPVFEKGSEHVIVQILSELAKTVGPLALVPDTGEIPVIVEGGADAEIIMAAWNRARDLDDV